MVRNYYDAQGQKTISLHPGATSTEEVFHAGALTLRAQGSSYAATKHIYAGGQRLASKMDHRWFTEDPVQYYATDHLGSTNFTFDSVGNVLSHTEYFPSGEIWRSETLASHSGINQYQFTGKEWDDVTGLYDFGYRSYDPVVGQWISPDPIMASYWEGAPNEGVYQPINLSAYAYAMNNPLVFFDPDGRYARISRRGNDIRIVIPILFRNESHLTQEQFQAKVDAWSSSIQRTWSGRFGDMKVNTSVEILNEAEAKEIGVQGGGLNVIEVGDPAKTNVASGEASVWSVSPVADDGWDNGNVVSTHKIKGTSEEGQGRLDSDSSNGTATHEAGHLLGLRHEEGPVSRDNVMATDGDKRKPGARPSVEQVRQIVSERCNHGCRPQTK